MYPSEGSVLVKMNMGGKGQVDAYYQFMGDEGSGPRIPSEFLQSLEVE